MRASGATKIMHSPGLAAFAQASSMLAALQLQRAEQRTADPSRPVDQPADRGRSKQKRPRTRSVIRWHSSAVPEAVRDTLGA